MHTLPLLTKMHMAAIVQCFPLFFVPLLLENTILLKLQSAVGAYLLIVRSAGSSEACCLNADSLNCTCCWHWKLPDVFVRQWPNWQLDLWHDNQKERKCLSRPGGLIVDCL